jgi:hypothetical protein
MCFTTRCASPSVNTAQHDFQLTRGLRPTDKYIDRVRRDPRKYKLEKAHLGNKEPFHPTFIQHSSNICLYFQRGSRWNYEQMLDECWMKLLPFIQHSSNICSYIQRGPRWNYEQMLDECWMERLLVHSKVLRYGPREAWPYSSHHHGEPVSAR